MQTSRLIELTRKAQTELKELLLFIERDIHEAGRLTWRHGKAPTGFPALDDALEGGIHRGATVEADSDSTELLLSMSLDWAAFAEANGTAVAFVDPFSEWDWAEVMRRQLEHQQTLLLTLQNPAALAQATLRVIEGKGIGLAIFPPGLLETRSLSDSKGTKRDRHFDSHTHERTTTGHR